MKFAAIIDYANDEERIDGAEADHCRYLRGLLDCGRLSAAGPLRDDLGALWVYDAESPEDAEDVVKADPFFAAGVFVRWQVFPLAYWSAKACKGEK